ncbi:MAG: ferrochelatase [Nitrososphaerota archaeon]|nr:ferrochelatase [Nitrososphaerota archaeon]
MKGVVLLAYGAPKSLDAVEAYYTNIRGGRKPSGAELANLVDRYRAIGGISPLIGITESLRDKLQSELRSEGSSTRVYSAMRHSPPFIPDVVRVAAGDGVTELLSVVLAPHYSKMSVGQYRLAVETANGTLSSGMRLDFVSSWHDNPGLIDAWAGRIRRAEKRLAGDYHLVFTAHSLPESIRREGDPYESQLLETAGLVVEKVGTVKQWSFAFQSASHTKEPWLGPDILDHLQALFQGGQRSFLIAPIGFLSDHLEILYDLDVECRQWAETRGARLVRTESLNDSDELVGLLHSLVTERCFA